MREQLQQVTQAQPFQCMGHRWVRGPHKDLSQRLEQNGWEVPRKSEPMLTMPANSTESSLIENNPNERSPDYAVRKGNPRQEHVPVRGSTGLHWLWLESINFYSSYFL